jgi:hypothetical protein
MGVLYLSHDRQNGWPYLLDRQCAALAAVCGSSKETLGKKEKIMVIEVMWHVPAMSPRDLAMKQRSRPVASVVKPAAGLRAHLTEEESVRSEACRDTRSDS